MTSTGVPQSPTNLRPRCSSCGAVAELRCDRCRSPICQGCAYGDRVEGYLCPACYDDQEDEER